MGAWLLHRETARYFCATEWKLFREYYASKRRIGISQFAVPGEAGFPVRPARAAETRSDSVRAGGRAAGAVVLAGDAFLHAQGNRQRRCRRLAEPRDARTGEVAVRSRLLESRSSERASDARMDRSDGGRRTAQARRRADGPRHGDDVAVAARLYQGASDRRRGVVAGRD